MITKTVLYGVKQMKKNKFHYADAVADMANKKYICDSCLYGDINRCKDFTGTGSGKKYHHIYCEKWRAKKDGKEKTD